MKRLLIVPLLFFLVDSFAQTETGKTQGVEDSAIQLQRRLKQQFDRYQQSMSAYETLVREKCQGFPESHLFPWVFPALAYGNLGLKHPDTVVEAIRSMEQFLVPGMQILERRHGTPLLAFRGYGGYATDLGQLNLALSLYRRLGGTNSDLLRVNDHVTGLLLAALEVSEGAPLDSYPGLVWPFDTMPIVVSLLLRDSPQSRVQVVAKAHLDWLQQKGLDEATGLPWSQSKQPIPRGCDLSLRLAQLNHFEPDLAETWYRRYLKHFWADNGFREWPRRRERGADIDSGPVINGIGMSATGNGIATVLSFQDRERTTSLLNLLNTRDLWVGLYQSSPEIRNFIDTEIFVGFPPFDPEFFTGMLYGDIALFYAVTWENYALELRLPPLQPE